MTQNNKILIFILLIQSILTLSARSEDRTIDQNGNIYAWSQATGRGELLFKHHRKEADFVGEAIYDLK